MFAITSGALGMLCRASWSVLGERTAKQQRADVSTTLRPKGEFSRGVAVGCWSTGAVASGQGLVIHLPPPSIVNNKTWQSSLQAADFLRFLLLPSLAPDIFAYVLFLKTCQSCPWPSLQRLLCADLLSSSLPYLNLRPDATTK